MTTLAFRLFSGAAAVAAATALLPALAGCSTATKEDHPAGHGTSAAASGAEKAPETAGAHNEDDVMFAQMMIPHHQQAVELSGLVPDRSTDPKVVKLAATIAGEQQPEIDFMTATLKQWGVDPAEMDHGSGHDGMTMQGMVNEETMVRLEGLKGPEFDTLWLQSMISHHQGAIEMAKVEVDAGKNPEMTALARSIIAAQQAEIDQMKQMLGS